MKPRLSIGKIFPVNIPRVFWNWFNNCPFEHVVGKLLAISRRTESSKSSLFPASIFAYRWEPVLRLEKLRKSASRGQRVGRSQGSISRSGEVDVETEKEEKERRYRPGTSMSPEVLSKYFMWGCQGWHNGRVSGPALRSRSSILPTKEETFFCRA